MSSKTKKYGEQPSVIGKIEASCEEMMTYQYMPITIPGQGIPRLEPRLRCVDEIISAAIKDHLLNFDDTEDMYIYLTVKHGWQDSKKALNRKGWHSDGFMTDDINYIWYDSMPTIFSTCEFNLTQNDELSLKEMEEQHIPWETKQYPVKTLLRLNQFNIHRVGDNRLLKGMRTFVKISFSKDKYNLKGNTKNYNLNYEWDMVDRKESRNIPQAKS